MKKGARAGVAGQTARTAQILVEADTCWQLTAEGLCQRRGAGCSDHPFAARARLSIIP